MIALYGKICLWLALFFAGVQSLLPLVGFYRSQAYLSAFARPAAIAQCICVFAAYALLTFAFASNDFSILYVAANSHASLPLMYKLTAVWGAHEGSILLWILLLNVWSMIFSFSTRSFAHAHDDKSICHSECSEESQSKPKRLPQLQSLTLAILGIISFSFICFSIFTSNPFLTTTLFLQGNDLNPLLQDPGFVIHPPMLYMGYVGFSVAFAITQAALISGKLDVLWLNLTRTFTIAAWCFLTFGILLGSWWAYRVLGWGGFWFWDPVENAALLPWLAGTAFIHILILHKKTKLATAWAASLAILSFGLSLLGTFLVRSGVLISAHTFANDPARGVFLLIIIAILLTIALLTYVFGFAKMPVNPLKLSWRCREMSLLLNSALLITAMLSILLGTIYPLIFDALHLGAISVGAPYFNKVMMPLLCITLLLMGTAPFLNWMTQPKPPRLFLKLLQRGLLSIIFASAILWSVMGQIEWMACLTLSLSFWVIQSVWSSWRFLPSMSIAHIGFAILIIGIMLSSLLSQEQDVRLKPGDTVNVGPYAFLFLDTRGIAGENYRGIQAAFDVTKHERHIVNLYPEKRIYTVRDMVMTKVDIHPSIFRDLYIALGEPLDNDYWSVRVYYKPFIRWIWFGGLMMMISGFFLLLKKYKTT